MSVNAVNSPRGVELAKFSCGDFLRGASPLKEVLWLLVRQVLFLSCPFSLSRVKCAVLRIFGARVGIGVIIKPQVKITFPWKLQIGDHVWLGEECWLLNLATIKLEDNVCISQRALLCTGNHDYTKVSFDLITRPIVVEEGGWIGAGAFVGPGVTVGNHAVLTAGSVAARDLAPWLVFSGNPAQPGRRREIRESEKPQ